MGFYFECATWLDEMKCHLVVKEISLVVMAENQDQAPPIKESRVGSQIPLPIFCRHNLETW